MELSKQDFAGSHAGGMHGAPRLCVFGGAPALVGAAAPAVGDTFIFNATLRENVALADSSATQARVERACQMTALGEIVARLPQGLDTPIAPGTLSDGERQRMGLARVLLHDAPFMILDEPTGNLDALNEAAVLHALEANRQGKAVFIVSHRPSAAAIADVTYVLNGNVSDS